MHFTDQTTANCYREVRNGQCTKVNALESFTTRAECCCVVPGGTSAWNDCEPCPELNSCKSSVILLPGERTLVTINLFLKKWQILEHLKRVKKLFIDCSLAHSCVYIAWGCVRSRACFESLNYLLINSDNGK